MTAPLLASAYSGAGSEGFPGELCAGAASGGGGTRTPPARGDARQQAGIRRSVTLNSDVSARGRGEEQNFVTYVWKRDSSLARFLE